MGVLTASRVQSTCGGRLTPHVLCPQAAESFKSTKGMFELLAVDVLVEEGLRARVRCAHALRTQHSRQAGRAHMSGTRASSPPSLAALRVRACSCV